MATCEQKVTVVSTHSKANQSGLKGKMHQQRSSTKQETVSNLLYETNKNCKTELGVKIKIGLFLQAKITSVLQLETLIRRQPLGLLVPSDLKLT